MRLLMLLMTIFFLASCKHSSKEISRQPGINLFFETTSIQKEAGNCSSNANTCARVSLRFPIAKKGTPALTTAINDTLLTYLVQQLTLKQPVVPVTLSQLDTAIVSYFLEWEQAQSGASENWQFTAEGEVVMQTAKVAVIFMTIRSCSGGVLPSTSSTAFNFNLKTGKMLQLEDFITHVPSLQKVVNREWNKLDLDSDRVTGDCSVPGLPSNFELKHDGICFWSQPLERSYSDFIGRHFVMSYEELGALVRKDKIF